MAYTFRPSEKNANKIAKILESERDKRNSPSINNTLEVIIMDYEEMKKSRVSISYNGMATQVDSIRKGNRPKYK